MIPDPLGINSIPIDSKNTQALFQGLFILIPFGVFHSGQCPGVNCPVPPGDGQLAQN